MKILIDADGCPVVKETINIAKENTIEVVVFCDTSHIINNDYAKTVIIINDSNLTMLLTTRHESKKARMAGAHLKGPKKRTNENDKAFIDSLNKLLNDETL